MHALRQTVIATTLMLALTLVALSAGAFALTFTTIDVPDATLTEASGINASGRIVGVYLDSTDTAHGYLLDKEGTFTPIDFTSSDGQVAVATDAFGINASGQIVGRYCVTSADCATEAVHGFLLDQKGTFTTIDVPDATFTNALGINDAGQIVGVYLDNSGTGHHGYVAQ